jgi:hypothetical protein
LQYALKWSPQVRIVGCHANVDAGDEVLEHGWDVLLDRRVSWVQRESDFLEPLQYQWKIGTRRPHHQKSTELLHEAQQDGLIQLGSRSTEDLVDIRVRAAEQCHFRSGSRDSFLKEGKSKR